MRWFIILFLLGSIKPLLSQKKLLFTDKSYEEEIRTVQLYPALNTAQDKLKPAVAPINNQNLVLEFDDLIAQRSNYYVRIVHCNYDWTKSSLQDLEFLNDYNEYAITDYDMSINTSVPYIHYYFDVPAVKIPGNYLLVAYRENNQNDILLSKRFMIYTNEVSLSLDGQNQGLGTLRVNNQQLNFKLNYAKVDVVNPMESINIWVRQNQRWDNAQGTIKPSFIREDRRELEYRFFDQSNQFMAGNEFRFVDFRSLNAPGQNTGRLDRIQRPFHLSVLTDRSREGQAYAQYRDMNGNYVIDNRDNRDPSLSGDYVYVTFTLASPPLAGHVHLMGALTDWDHTAASRMNYNSSLRAYEKTLFLKQGWYDYQYWVEGANQNSFQVEGSHFETENLYEVFIYYRPFRPQADLLVGYYQLPANSR
ncbi:MAG: DUF5103 domain-containing protein [Cyclobacteriaceae bacterium]|nr:DUF5103 domain-containing protein [Cyclobacteriaceae bacterium]